MVLISICILHTNEQTCSMSQHFKQLENRKKETSISLDFQETWSNKVSLSQFGGFKETTQTVTLWRDTMNKILAINFRPWYCFTLCRNGLSSSQRWDSSLFCWHRHMSRLFQSFRESLIQSLSYWSWNHAFSRHWPTVTASVFRRLSIIEHAMTSTASYIISDSP